MCFSAVIAVANKLLDDFKRLAPEEQLIVRESVISLTEVRQREALTACVVPALAAMFDFEISRNLAAKRQTLIRIWRTPCAPVFRMQGRETDISLLAHNLLDFKRNFLGNLGVI